MNIVCHTRGNSRDEPRGVTLNSHSSSAVGSTASTSESPVKVFSRSFFQDTLLCNMIIIQIAVNWEFPDFCHLFKKTLKPFTRSSPFFPASCRDFVSQLAGEVQQQSGHTPARGGGREPWRQSPRLQIRRNFFRPNSPTAQRGLSPSARHTSSPWQWGHCCGPLPAASSLFRIHCFPTRA